MPEFCPSRRFHRLLIRKFWNVWMWNISIWKNIFNAEIQAMKMRKKNSLCLKISVEAVRYLRTCLAVRRTKTKFLNLRCGSGRRTGTSTSTIATIRLERRGINLNFNRDLQFNASCRDFNYCHYESYSLFLICPRLYSHIENRVFASLANGDVVVYERDSQGGWSAGKRHVVSLSTAAAPVTKMVVATGKLWCSASNMITILQISSLEIEVGSWQFFMITIWFPLILITSAFIYRGRRK